MKKFSWFLGLAILIISSGCFDTLEEVTIAENGSGTFVNTLDMGKILGMAKSMGGGQDDLKDIEKLKMDTVINLRDIKDSLKNLNDAEKKIAGTGTLKIQIDANEEKMNFTFSFPFSKPADISGIQNVLKKSKQDVLDKIMEKIFLETGADKTNGMFDKGEKDEDESMSPNLDEYYSTVFEKGKMSRKLNKEKYARVEDDKSLKSLQEMAQMGLAINMKTVINLPKPAKKVTGKGLKLSEDKKKITMEGTLDDFFEDASYFEYDIEY
jgi:hypothetical protein